MVKTIGNPLTWTAELFGVTGQYLADATERMGGRDQPSPQINDVTIDDLKAALRAGLSDFMTLRSDVIFIAILYPVIGVFLAMFAFNEEYVPYLFPLASGFALLGPVAATGLYELSRRREAGFEVHWTDSLAPIQSPSLGPILTMALYLLGIFAVWMFAAHLIFRLTIGTEVPPQLGAFLLSVLGSPAGWAMILIGIPVGAVFAAAAFTLAVVSFPLLVDRNVGVPKAIMTSVRLVQKNPKTMAVWAVTIGLALTLGSIPMFLGLIVVLPILGHASWHVYRRAVAAGDIEKSGIEGGGLAGAGTDR